MANEKNNGESEMGENGGWNIYCSCVWSKLKFLGEFCDAKKLVVCRILFEKKRVSSSCGYLSA